MKVRQYEMRQAGVPASYMLKMASMGVVEIKMYDAYLDGKDTGVRAVTSVDEMKGKTELKDGIRHLSVFHETRTPSISEVTHIKNALFPDVEMAMYFPNQILNLSNTHHLWEVKTQQVNGKIIQTL